MLAHLCVLMINCRRGQSCPKSQLTPKAQTLMSPSSKTRPDTLNPKAPSLDLHKPEARKRKPFSKPPYHCFIEPFMENPIQTTHRISRDLYTPQP